MTQIEDSNTKKNDVSFSFLYERFARKETILRVLDWCAKQELSIKLDADKIAEKIQLNLRRFDNHCIDDYDVLQLLRDLGEEQFISYISNVVWECEMEEDFSNNFRQNLINKLTESNEEKI